MSDEINDLRVEMRLKNSRLYNYIYKNYKTVGAFCEKNNLSPITISGLLNLRYSIRKKNGNYTETVEKISIACETYPEILFPDDIYGLDVTKKAIEIPVSNLNLEQKEQMYLTMEQGYIEEHENKILEENVKEKLQEVLGTLPPREQEVLKMRYGLGGGKVFTLQETGLYFNVTRERVREIEAKALRRLRHPKRNRKIRDYIDIVN